MSRRGSPVDTAVVTSPVPALLGPPVRLGRLLRDARLSQRETVAELVHRSGLAFDEEWFVNVELGRVELDEPLVRWLGELYGVKSSELVPARSELVIDLSEGWVSAGDERRLVRSAEPDRILTDYLALVYLLRGLPAGTPISLRDMDVTVLSDALRRKPSDIRARLDRLIDAESAPVVERTSVLRRRLVVPVAGILVGLTAVGGLLLVRSAGAGADDSSDDMIGVGAGATVPTVEIGEAVVLEPGSPQHAR
jgi:hypothetical protein